MSLHIPKIQYSPWLVLGNEKSCISGGKLLLNWKPTQYDLWQESNKFLLWMALLLEKYFCRFLVTYIIMSSGRQPFQLRAGMIQRSGRQVSARTWPLSPLISLQLHGKTACSWSCWMLPEPHIHGLEPKILWITNPWLMLAFITVAQCFPWNENL